MSRKYDAIVIGAGISGLILGTTLAKKGKKVLMLEHAPQVGGNMMGFIRKGFYFDAGDQSTESVGILFPILQDLGLYNPEEWHRADWRIVTPHADVKLRDYEQIRADFKRAYPESSRDLDTWFDFLTKGCMIFKDMMSLGDFPLVRQGMEKWRMMLEMSKAAIKFAPLAKECITKTGTQKCREIFRDPNLAFLFGEFGNANMMLFMFFSFWYCFIYDYWYPKGGLQGFVNKVADAYRKMGGELHLKTTVEKVLLKGNRANGVRTEQGEEYFADKIIHSGNLKHLVLKMTDPSLFPYKYTQVIKEAPVSFGMPAAYLGLDIGDEEMMRYMKGHHTFYWRTYETITDTFTPDAHRRGFSQFSWTSMHDKDLAPEGKNSLVIQVFTNYNWMDGWGTGTEDPTVRTEAYKELKARVLDDIIADSEHIIPGLSKRIVFKDLGTPRTLSRYTLNEQGAPMGWSYDMYRIFMAKRFGSFTTPIQNLYTCGHYSIWPGGVVFAALSARIVAEAMDRGLARALLW